MSTNDQGAVVDAWGRATLLGPPSLTGPRGQVPVTRPQVQLVLAYLLWEPKPTTIDALADVLWGDRPLTPHWRGAVRGVLSKVRDSFEAAGIPADLGTGADGLVRLSLPEGFAVDVHDAAAAVEAAEASQRSGELGGTATALSPWVKRLQQPFLPACDGDWERWALGRIEDLGRRAVVVYGRALIASGRSSESEASLRRWVARHPLDEPVHHLLIQSLVADGRRPDARAAFDRLREVLDHELGIGPAAATAALLGPEVGGVGRRPQGAASPAAPAPALGRAASELPTSPMLGRAAETADLRSMWESVVDGGRPAMVLLRGPSGIGKTRLAAEFQEQAGGDGARTLRGRCAPGASLPFEPITSTVVSALAGTPHGAELQASIHDEERAPEDPAAARARMFRSITGAMQRLVDGPAVLVVDDLQWIDADGLTLLEHVVTTMEAPLLVVATGRELPDAVHEMMARLARQVSVRTISLRGLTVDDLLPLFIADDGSERTADERAEALHRHTGGIPFFVSEIARSSLRTGTAIGDDAVPDAVREWIGHRVDALEPQLRSRLDLAAVIGPRVRVPDLASCAQATIDTVIDDVEDLIELGFLTEEADVGVVSLPHLITQEIVYERLGAIRRARLHLAAAEGLASDPDANPAVIAAHLDRAGPEHGDAAARNYSEAAEAAYRRGAWALAAARQRSALAAAQDLPTRRATALVGLGRALHSQGMRDEAEAHLDEAMAVAREHRLELDLAEAAIALVGRAGRGATRRPDADQIALLEEALAALERADAADPMPADLVVYRKREALRCRVEVELALALSLWASLERRSALAASALERARRLEPPDADLTAQCLLGNHAVRLSPSQTRDRLVAETEVLAIPLASRSIDTTLTALTYRYEDLLRFGKRDEARTYLDAAIELAERYDHPYWGWATATWLGLDALVVGDLERAEELAGVAAARPNSDEGGALACFGVNVVNIRLCQGRTHEVLGLLGDAARRHPEIPCYQAVLALCAAEAGEVDLAREAFEPFHRSDFTSIPHDTNRLLSLGVLADTAVHLRAASAVPALRSMLAPYVDQHLLLNCYGGGGAYWGPVAASLDRLATV